MFVNGQKTGHGILVYRNQEVYIGDFKENKREG